MKTRELKTVSIDFSKNTPALKGKTTKKINTILKSTKSTYFDKMKKIQIVITEYKMKLYGY